MVDIEFQSLTEFYNFINDNDMEITPVLSRFKEAVENINVGCGCAKKSRTKKAEAHYMSLQNSLDLTAKESILNIAKADGCKFYHNGSLFFEF